MRTKSGIGTWTRVAVSVAVLGSAGLISTRAWAHCDTLNGPVVKTARIALDKGDVTPVLKWVKKENEAEIRAAFKKTLAVRTKGAEAKALADTYFFETLVRVHRAGEGAPYTGLKATPPEPIIAQADRALETGSVENLVKAMTNHVATGIRRRFASATEGKKKAEKSVEAGREFVEAYVQFTHYLEGLHGAATGQGHHGKADAEKHAHTD